MRTLWRTTTYLFWQHPILWLPVVLADLIAFCLRNLQIWMTHAVVQSLGAPHSVLSSTPEPLQTLPVAWVVAFAASRFLVELLNACLYAAAMIAVSLIIPALMAEKRIPWRQVPPAVRQSRIQILLLLLKAFGMFVVATFLGLEIITYLPRLHFLPLSLTIDSRREGYVVEAVLLAAVAWILAPSAVAILRPRESPVSDTRRIRHARILAAVSVSAAAAMYVLATAVEPSFAPFLTTGFRVQAYWAIASAASAIPYIPLFIAFYLIANPDTPLAIPSPANTEPVDSAPDGLPE
jgi:hypothetical protein